MDEASRREGRTVLLVSHNLGIVEKLCQRCLWLDRGWIREAGSAAVVVKHYMSAGQANRDRVIPLADVPRHYYGGDKLCLLAIEWLCNLPLKHTERVTLRIVFETLVPLAYATLWFAFCDLFGRHIAHYEIDSRDSCQLAPGHPDGRHRHRGAGVAPRQLSDRRLVLPS